MLRNAERASCLLLQSIWRALLSIEHGYLASGVRIRLWQKTGSGILFFVFILLALVSENQLGSGSVKIQTGSGSGALGLTKDV